MNARMFRPIPLPVPMERIWMRLGYNRHKTDVPAAQVVHFEDLAHKGYDLCEIQGTYALLAVVSKTDQAIGLESDHVFASAGLCTMTGDATHLLLTAATVGAVLPEARDEALARGNATCASIYDAVGSECADCALLWLQNFARDSLRRGQWRIGDKRFSPGYGDLDLAVQKDLYALLDLERLGLALTPRCLLLPEKSVIGITPVWYAGPPESTET